MRKFLIFTFLIIFLCSPTWADELGELKAMMQSMQKQMAQMQVRINELENERTSKPDQASNEEVTASKNRVNELEAAQVKLNDGILSSLNPQISVIGDFVYHATDENGGELDNDFNFRETEIALSANIDTYARGDFYVAIENEDGETEVALEEGYLTLLETPVENLQGKFGKFRPNFGKANRMHLHSMPWTTYPLVIQNYFGEEGFSEAGASLSYLIPNPFDFYSELTVEAVNNTASVLGGGEEGETLYLGHWKNFFEITDDTSLEVGGSHLFGDNGNGDGTRTKISGLDLTLNTELWDGFKTVSHTEALFSKYENPGEDDADSWGMFSSLEQQLALRWWAFGRFDYSQMPTASEEKAYAYSTGLTFAQSEYAFWRLMFTHTDNKMTEDSNEVWLQLNFGIGPHRPHTYR